MLQNAYSVSNETIATISLIYMAIFIIFVLPTNYILDRAGLRVGVTLGVALTAIGMWIKCLINYNFNYVLIGQIFAAFGQPLISCAPAKLAALWFGENERIVAVTIGSAAQPLGVAIGYVLPSLFVSTQDSQPEFIAQAR